MEGRWWSYPLVYRTIPRDLFESRGVRLSLVQDAKMCSSLTVTSESIHPPTKNGFRQQHSLRLTSDTFLHHSRWWKPRQTFPP